MVYTGTAQTLCRERIRDCLADIRTARERGDIGTEKRAEAELKQLWNARNKAWLAYDTMRFVLIVDGKPVLEEGD